MKVGVSCFLPFTCRALVCIESEKQGTARRRKNIIKSTFSSSLDDFQLLGPSSAVPLTPGVGRELLDPSLLSRQLWACG